MGVKYKKDIIHPDGSFYTLEEFNVNVQYGYVMDPLLYYGLFQILMEYGHLSY